MLVWIIDFWVAVALVILICAISFFVLALGWIGLLIYAAIYGLLWLCAIVGRLFRRRRLGRARAVTL